MNAKVVHGATLTSRCGSTLPLQISDARAVQLLTTGNDREGFEIVFGSQSHNSCSQQSLLLRHR